MTPSVRTEERRLALKAVRALERAELYLRSGRPESALRICHFEAEDIREDLKDCLRAARKAAA